MKSATIPTPVPWCLLLCLLSLFLILPVQAPAQSLNLSDEQLRQLRSLPREQQEALARQQGIDLDQFTSGSGQQQERPRDIQVVQTPLSDPERYRDLDSDKERNELKPFGYELFAGRPTTFAPVTEIPLPSEYIIGPGDVIKLQLFGKENEQLELPVTRDGAVQMTDTGPIVVAGMAFEDVRTLLKERVQQKYIGTQASVSLGELRSMRVFVLGEARHPGSYTVSSLSTMTNALLVSGGVKTSGSLRQVQLKRDGEVIGTLDLYDLLLNGDTASDQRLQSGDTLFIPPVGETVAVEGEVRRPAIYELKGDETLADMIAMAGGYTRDAAPAYTRLERVDDRRRRSLESVDLTQGAARRQSVRQGDKVIIKSLSDITEGFVALRGSAERPGKREFRPGMRLSDLIGDRRQDLESDVDLNYALVVRELNDQGHIAVKQFRPVDLFREAGGESDLVLQERDQILLFSLEDRGAVDEEALEEVERADLDSLKEAGRRQAQLQSPAQARSTGIGPGQTYAQKLVTEKGEDQEENRKTGRQLLDEVLEQLDRQATPQQPARAATVGGAVRFPGRYPIASDATAEDLVAAAGGLKDSALLLEAEVVRASVNEGGMAETELLTFTLFQGVENGAGDIALEGYDRLLIKAVPGFAEREVITLEGEVRFPGEYSIRLGDSLADVLERAGGLTERAFPEGAMFSRERLRLQERKRMEVAEQRLRRDLLGLQLEAGKDAGDMDLGLLQNLLQQVQGAEAMGRLVIDLEGLLKGRLEALEVMDGDRLEVPRRAQSVSVFGEVQFASSHLYEPGLDVMDYLERSGGFTAQADKDRIYVIRADGSVWRPQRSRWFAGGGRDLRPGDTIVAPIKLDRINTLQLTSNISQIFSNLAVSAAALRSF